MDFVLNSFDKVVKIGILFLLFIVIRRMCIFLLGEVAFNIRLTDYLRQIYFVFLLLDNFAWRIYYVSLADGNN